MRFDVCFLLGITFLAGCPGSQEVKKKPYMDAFPGIEFDRPVYFAEVPGKRETFLILEQPGHIQVVGRKGAGWAKSEFAKIKVSGGTSGGDERGLLGFAFHPNFLKNRKYYLGYVLGSENLVAEGIADSTLIKDSGTPLRTVLRIDDPYGNHNGGTLGFGPKDGFLYIGTGDGGAGGDPLGNGQSKQSLLGKFLRIDVDTRTEGKPYGIPADNPFVAGSGAPEIWAYGLRNPWKWSFDPITGELWAGDVGQNRLEEVDLIEKGGNYGWSTWEGDRCHPSGGTECKLEGHKPPLFTYDRSSKGGTSITGGVVYRGNPKSPHYGAFIFGDYESDNIWALKKNGRATALPRLANIGISSFGTDSKGQVYVMGINSESIYRMENLSE